MPKKGFEVVTIRDTVLRRIEEIAKTLGKSVPETIQYLAENANINPPVVSQCPKTE